MWLNDLIYHILIAKVFEIIGNLTKGSRDIHKVKPFNWQSLHRTKNTL